MPDRQLWLDAALSIRGNGPASGTGQLTPERPTGSGNQLAVFALPD